MGLFAVCVLCLRTPFLTAVGQVLTSGAWIPPALFFFKIALVFWLLFEGFKIISSTSTKDFAGVFTGLVSNLCFGGSHIFTELSLPAGEHTTLTIHLDILRLDRKSVV